MRAARVAAAVTWLLAGVTSLGAAAASRGADPLPATGYAGKTFDWWIEELPHPGRCDVAEAVLAAAGADAVPALLQATEHATPYIRRTAVRLLARTNATPEGSVDRVRDVLRTGTPNERRAALQLLLRVPADELPRATLLPEMRALAAYVHPAFDPEFRRVLESAGEAPEQFVVWTIDAIARSRTFGTAPSESFDVLAAHPNVTRRHLDEILEVTAKSDESTRRLLLRPLALVAPEDPRVVAMLRAALEKSDTRAAAVDVLASVVDRSDAALAVLVPALAQDAASRARVVRRLLVRPSPLSTGARGVVEGLAPHVLRPGEPVALRRDEFALIARAGAEGADARPAAITAIVAFLKTMSPSPENASGEITHLSAAFDPPPRESGEAPVADDAGVVIDALEQFVLDRSADAPRRRDALRFLASSGLDRHAERVSALLERVAASGDGDVSAAAKSVLDSRAFDRASRGRR